MMYMHACNNCMSATAAIPTPNPEISDIPYISGNATQKNIKPPVGLPAPGTTELPVMGASGLPVGESEGGIALRVRGLPLFKPPYGIVTAINLDKGEIAWQVPHGDTPDAIRNNPALKGLNIPRTGQPANPTLGTLVTKALVIIGDPEVTTTSTHPRGALLHAYDKATGAEVGSVYMPAPQTGSPMTYMLNGKQYIVIAIGGGNYAGEYVAFRLPKNTD
jgi:quinoprotein glucose dehydrogenase